MMELEGERGVWMRTGGGLGMAEELGGGCRRTGGGTIRGSLVFILVYILIITNEPIIPQLYQI